MKNSNENISLVIVIIIIVAALSIFLYSFVKNNSKLINNTSEYKSDVNSDKSTATKDATKEVQDEKVNIDENTYKKYEESKKNTETEIASYTSTLYDKDENRVANISLAVSKINNYIIKAGEEFSFNSTVGPMDEEHGFKKAVGFDSYGNKIDVPGGGMCQISSTMYNSALIAGLEITERHPHSRRVYYVPKDKDATIYYGTLDLKFVNNTKNDIKIFAETDGQNVTIKLFKLE